jgi:hypothetical protein
VETERKKRKYTKRKTDGPVYAWDEWVKPGKRLLVQGVDFACTICQFYNRLRTHTAGVHLKFRELPDGKTVEIYIKEAKHDYTPRSNRNPPTQPDLLDRVLRNRSRESGRARGNAS